MIINPFSNIPVHNKSHVRGWAQHWANCLGTKVASKTDLYKDADNLYIDHGVNYGGGLNLFGGVTEDVFNNLSNLANSEANLFSLDIDMPDYATMLKKRIGQSTCHIDLPLIIDQLENKLKSSKTITQYDIAAENIIIGDSHSTAYANRNSSVIRTNGKTLHGALKNNYIFEIISNFKYKYNKITLCFGAIDIRHHLMRTENPNKSLINMLDDYIKLCLHIKETCGLEIEVCAPPPVEFTGRRIPKTGFYNGTPFYGSLEDRAALTMLFIVYLKEQGINVVHQPLERYSMDPEVYSKEYMELGSSVHIAPIHYRSNSDWGM